MKAEFKEDKETGHVGLYKSDSDELVVLFSDDKNANSGVVIVSNGRLTVG